MSSPALKNQLALPLFSSRATYQTRAARNFARILKEFTFNGAPTIEVEKGGLQYFVNEFWTAGQRQAHSIHEISYRACFKPQLPEFFISRITNDGQTVYDPFSGRGTTVIEAALMGRRPVANDINPLSKILVRPRLDSPTVEMVRNWQTRCQAGSQ